MEPSPKDDKGIPAIPVRFQPPGEMNLIGYFLRGLMRRGLASGGPRLHRRLIGTRCLVRSEGMEVTISINEDSVEIRRGRWPRIDATVEADLVSLTKVLSGTGMISSWLEGKVVARGKIWRLFPLVRLLRAGLDSGNNAEGAG